MGKFLKSCLNGIFMGVKPWIFFGLLIPILFFIIHPFDPIVVFGVSMLVAILYLVNKWKKEMPVAKKATEEAEKAGVKFVDIDPVDESKESPLKRFKNKFYPLLGTSILSACMLSCSYQIIHSGATERERKAALMGLHEVTPSGEGRKVAVADSSDIKEWNINNIEMVHLSDPDQYVTNSDSILSQETVDQMNAILKELDSIGKVKSAVVVCHKLSNNDSYRTAVDLVNKYGIGSKESGKGICIVVAYDQHKYTLAPSRDMEGDLPDAVCSQLGRNYLQPYLKNEQPDSAMLCLTQALSKYVMDVQASAGDFTSTCNTLKNRGIFSGQSGMNMLIILLICMLLGYFDDQYKWTKPAKNMAPVAKMPEEEPEQDEQKTEKLTETTVPPQKPGGSYGGGSSGGGGATGEW